MPPELLTTSHQNSLQQATRTPYNKPSELPTTGHQNSLQQATITPYNRPPDLHTTIVYYIEKFEDTQGNP
jgi:hypothetical protein